MRPRTELAIALGVSVTLVVIAFASGTRARPRDNVDMRASTFNSGREGAQALVDVAERVGVTVTRWRVRPQRLAARLRDVPPGVTGRSVVAVLAPPGIQSRDDRVALLRLPSAQPGSDLVIAGRSLNPAVQCLGYRVTFAPFDSTRVDAGGGAADTTEPHVHEYLTRYRPPDAASDATDERDDEESQPSCPPLTVTAHDTLLSDVRGRPLMVRLTVAPHAHTVLLVSDHALVRNRTLRAGATGARVVDAIVPRDGWLIVDEYHQGYAEGGSMAGAVLAWSRRSPWGWMVWQWCAIGIIALAAGAVRFGPVRAAIPRTRRSSLEHVRALATALAASRGHRTAVGAMVRGLQRRLAPGRTSAATSRDDWRGYLAALRARAPNPQVQASAAQLERLADHPHSETAVLSAAHAVEDLWHSLRP